MSSILKKFGWSVIALLAIGSILGIFASAEKAKADISNPHPTPPANSITNTMLQPSIILPSNINIPQQFLFQNVLATSTTAATTTTTGEQYIPASTTINSVPYKWPAAQGAANTVLTNNASGNLSWVLPSVNKIFQTFTAGETITAGDAVSFGDGTSTTIAKGTKTQNDSSVLNNTNWFAYEFNNSSFHAFSVLSVTIDIESVGGTTFISPQCVIYTNNSGSPSANSIATTTAATQQTNLNITHTFTCAFSSPVAVTDNTIYWVVFTDTNQCNATDECQIPETAANTNGDEVTTNSGTSWTATAGNLLTTLTYAENGIGDIYEASSAAFNYRLTGFAGFAENGGAAGSQIVVDMEGYSTATTTLQANTLYYLNDTNGQVGRGPGTKSQTVGVGVGGNAVLIQHVNL